MFTIGQIRSFCERQEGYHASGIIDILHFCRFQWNYNMRAIVKISPILYKFLKQTILWFTISLIMIQIPHCNKPSNLLEINNLIQYLASVNGWVQVISNTFKFIESMILTELFGIARSRLGEN